MGKGAARLVTTRQRAFSDVHVPWGDGAQTTETPAETSSPPKRRLRSELSAIRTFCVERGEMF
eukprot:SAG31_NODE_9457_length_1274_cov_1.673191_1_plen_63_part_00